MFRSVSIFKQFKRSLSTKATPILELLTERTLLKITGNDISDYLQGLITNDIKHLSNNGNCMYTMFLNTKGRVLYDVIIYKTIESNTYLLECDIRAVESLRKHLQIYKLRKKIDINNLTDQYTVHVVFNSLCLESKELDLFSKNTDNVFDKSSKNLINDTNEIKIYNGISIYSDPRMTLLGSRILAPKGISVRKTISELIEIREQSENESYRWFRYNLGVGEGIDDLPPENCFPLEANCDYLHGVSFHKGCYIGQELTARTYHTGVVRKRLMPLIFKKLPSKTDSNIINDNVNLGKLRGMEGNAGLALLRISQSLNANEIKVCDGIAVTHKPIWWPIEAPKEKIVVQKSD